MAETAKSTREGACPVWLGLCVSGGVPRRSLGVAAVVGTVLNVINQGDVLVAGGQLDLVKLGLTYMVPYCVATFGAVSARLHDSRHHRSRAHEHD